MAAPGRATFHFSIRVGEGRMYGNGLDFDARELRAELAGLRAALAESGGHAARRLEEMIDGCVELLSKEIGRGSGIDP